MIEKNRVPCLTARVCGDVILRGWVVWRERRLMRRRAARNTRLVALRQGLGALNVAQFALTCL